MAVNETDFGKLLGTVEAIKKDLTEVENDLKTVKAQLATINTAVSEFKGGMRVAVWFSGILGGLVVFIGPKLLAMVGITLPKL